MKTRPRSSHVTTAVGVITQDFAECVAKK